MNTIDKKTCPYLSVVVGKCVSTGIAPPNGSTDVPRVKDEEDEQTGNGDTGIKSGGGEVVVSRPPVKLVTSGVEAEDDSKKETRRIHVRIAWGHVSSGGQEHGPVNILQKVVVGELLDQKPGNEGKESTSQETILGRSINGAILSSEDASGSNGTPNDRSRVESFGVTARVRIIGNLGVAKFLLGVHQPGRGGQVNDAGGNGRDQLSHEHDSWGDFHVVS